MYFFSEVDFHDERGFSLPFLFMLPCVFVVWVVLYALLCVVVGGLFFGEMDMDAANIDKATP